MAKSFNRAIVLAREKPICTMLEEIRAYFMTRWAENRELGRRFDGTILPRIRKKLERRGRFAGHWWPFWSGARKYQVRWDTQKFVVDLAKKECSCRRFQMSGLPCIHAIACINFKALSIDVYVDDFYKRDAYLKCYGSAIHPCNGPDLWEKQQFDDILPPHTKNQATDPPRREGEDLVMRMPEIRLTFHGLGRFRDAPTMGLLGTKRVVALSHQMARPNNLKIARRAQHPIVKARRLPKLQQEVLERKERQISDLHHHNLHQKLLESKDRQIWELHHHNPSHMVLGQAEFHLEHRWVEQGEPMQNQPHLNNRQQLSPKKRVAGQPQLHQTSPRTCHHLSPPKKHASPLLGPPLHNQLEPGPDFV